MSAHFQTIIIGSGFGGQCAAVNLKRLGLDDFVILERRSFIGGTWKQNRYPGAAVDVYSPLYSLSFAPYDWSQLFADQRELSEYTDGVFSQFSLTEKTRTNCNVVALKWQPEARHWSIELASGECLTAQFVVNATGPLSTPVIPSFKGKASFSGAQFHTNDWDESYDYRGKRVAIIGSGASAVQVIPAIADKVASLHVFQRTPHWVIPRPDKLFKPWQRAFLRTALGYQLVRKAIYWGLEIRILGFKYSRRLLNILGTRPALRHLKKQIADPDLRDRLTPDYTIGCKRILLSNTYYPALCKDNVVLHDKHDGLEQIEETGVVTRSGQHIPVDLIVYATGYDATDGLISYPVYGENQVSLSERWADFPRAYLGTSVPDFPNLFIVTGPNTGIGHTSALFIIEAQMRYITGCIKETLSSGATSIEVLKSAENAYTESIHTEMDKTVWQTGGCNSWYKSSSGKVIAMFPGFSFTYRRLCNRFKRAHHKLR